ncbi:coleoptericin-like [Sitophilus oryzae]|uniref:Coleoptericin-like n=1 Tax=Sitophilus oryzae TaxID=7048 RepID=A0A6J2X3Y7_SITOR|nr:coleoptericin-like [Sitophilus oryzae]
MTRTMLFLACVAALYVCVSATAGKPEEFAKLSDGVPSNDQAMYESIQRYRRFVEGNRHNGGQQQQQPKQWEVRPDLSRDQRGNTKAQVEINKQGENHDINAGWGKNIKGPDSHKDTWHVGGSVRW